MALVDKNYATSHGLKVGGTMKIGGVKFTIIGIVTQPRGSSPPNVYIPLTRAQAARQEQARPAAASRTTSTRST